MVSAIDFLQNTRGAGELIFEHDFPLGTDVMREIREGPHTAERSGENGD